ncbi:MAG: glycogen debranching protein GlgX [Verrucomicrobiota bacterium]
MKILFETQPGSTHPLGATLLPGGVNFSLFSQNATGVDLLLFANHDDPQAFQVIRLDPVANRSFHFWHVLVRGLAAGAFYAFRVSGPFDPASGLRFNSNKVLIDPYARGNTNNLWKRADACTSDDNVATSMRSVVIDPASYNWEGDQPLGRPMEETIIYELHTRGFTQSPSSATTYRGKFAAVAEKIPYLRALGVTAVELLPVFDFDETDAHIVNGQRLPDYWGYSTLGFFAPQSAYCVSPESGGHLREFRDMVKELHKAGIEVILDVVFNHTDEGNQLGPTFSFRGIDNRTYYFLVPGNLATYLDFSGCGNTFNCNHPIAGKLIVECLRYWVREAHVDGFRFDEGSILTRDEAGGPNPHSPVVWAIELEDDLADTKLIAEAWDAGGLYQVGGFPGDRWAEWNGRFRDDIRRFVRGDPGLVGAVASRLSGSSDLYQAQGRLPINSINFITCHDGFTLNDLVSYNEKHNEGNGEANRDGIDNNLSWNCGEEGPAGDPLVEALRRRQLRNFAAILLLSRGVPMFVAGDEARRTQQGNNNAWCQDNPVSWFDWTLADTNADLVRFWQRMIAFRREHVALWRGRFFAPGEVAWHGTQLNSPGWSDPQAHALAMTLTGTRGEADLHVMLNMYWQSLDFQLPPDRLWVKSVDTAAAPPHDIEDPGQEAAVTGPTCKVQGRSVVVLICRTSKDQ